MLIYFYSLQRKVFFCVTKYKRTENTITVGNKETVNSLEVSEKRLVCCYYGAVSIAD